MTKRTFKHTQCVRILMKAMRLLYIVKSMFLLVLFNNKFICIFFPFWCIVLCLILFGIESPWAMWSLWKLHFGPTHDLKWLAQFVKDTWQKNQNRLLTRQVMAILRPIRSQIIRFRLFYFLKFSIHTWEEGMI